MKRRKVTVSDGTLVLVLTPDEGRWYTVTSPMDPALITCAKSIDEAFEMAYDAQRALAISRADPHRFDGPPKKAKVKRASRKLQLA